MATNAETKSQRTARSTLVPLDEHRGEHCEREAHQQEPELLERDEHAVRVVHGEHREAVDLALLEARWHHRDLHEVVDEQHGGGEDREAQRDQAEDLARWRRVVVDARDEHHEEQHQQHRGVHPQVVRGPLVGDGVARERVRDLVRRRRQREAEGEDGEAADRERDPGADAHRGGRRRWRWRGHHPGCCCGRRADTAGGPWADPERPCRPPLGAGTASSSGRGYLNLHPFPGREACCHYTTSAQPASDETDAKQIMDHRHGRPGTRVRVPDLTLSGREAQYRSASAVSLAVYAAQSTPGTLSPADRHPTAPSTCSRRMSAWPAYGSGGLPLEVARGGGDRVDHQDDGGGERVVDGGPPACPPVAEGPIRSSASVAHPPLARCRVVERCVKARFALGNGPCVTAHGGAGPRTAPHTPTCRRRPGPGAGSGLL